MRRQPNTPQLTGAPSIAVVVYHDLLIIHHNAHIAPAVRS
jgi:hypothetical protein